MCWVCGAVGVLCDLTACGCVLRQLNYNCITRLGLFSRRHSERQGSRTEGLQPLFWKARVMHFTPTHSFTITSLISSVSLSLSLSSSMSPVLPYTTHALTHRTTTHYKQQHTHVNEHAHIHRHMNTHEHTNTDRHKRKSVHVQALRGWKF